MRAGLRRKTCKQAVPERSIRHFRKLRRGACPAAAPSAQQNGCRALPAADGFQRPPAARAPASGRTGTARAQTAWGSRTSGRAGLIWNASVAGGSPACRSLHGRARRHTVSSAASFLLQPEDPGHVFRPLWPARLRARLHAAARRLRPPASLAPPRSRSVDRLPAYNRWMFGVNEKLDEYLLKPVAQGLSGGDAAVPRRRHHQHLRQPRRPADRHQQPAAVRSRKPQDFTRIVFNSTFGLLGFFDVASYSGILKHDEDFWPDALRTGVGEGSYLLLPFGSAEHAARHRRPGGSMRSTSIRFRSNCIPVRNRWYCASSTSVPTCCAAMRRPKARCSIAANADPRCPDAAPPQPDLRRQRPVGRGASTPTERALRRTMPRLISAIAVRRCSKPGQCGSRGCRCWRAPARRCAGWLLAAVDRSLR